MDEWKTGYSSYDRDRLDAADKMKIERGIYFDTKGADISPLTALPLAELVKLREESAAAEQTVFENLKVQASAWEEQAGKTLLFDKAIEYARIPEVKHTANKWQDEDNDRHTISNRVYKMSYHVYENTRYDKAAQKSIPYSYTLSWNIYTNSPHGYGQAKIAGQDRKVFADRAAMEKYLNGRVKAYEKLFTEISPAIPPEYAEQFKVNGQLLPGYTVEGEEIKQPAADIPAAAPRTEPGQETEQFAILIDSRTRFETGEPGGYWLSMPATKEQLHEAMQSVGITADNPQDFFIHGYKDVFAALEKTSPVPVGFEKIEGGAHGYYHLEDKRIALDEGMSELQTLKTLLYTAVILAILFVILIVSAIGMFYYAFSIPEPEGLSLASWPHTFTDNFSTWIEEKDGNIGVEQIGAERLDEYGLWVQILDENGQEIYAHNKPENYPDGYSMTELVELTESGYENGNTVFISNVPLARLGFKKHQVG